MLSNLTSHLTIVVLILTISFLPGCEPVEKRVLPSTTVKIGVIGPFSGDDINWGESGMRGVETALKLLEQSQEDFRIELVKADDANDPETARMVFRKLVIEDQVSAIIMLSGSVSTLAIADIADLYETPVISALSTHPGVTSNEWISQVVFDDRFQATVAALFVADELLFDRVGVIQDSGDPHSSYLADTFSEKFTNAGGLVVRVDISLAGEKETMASFRDTELDFIYIAAGVDTVAAFERGARELGWHPQVMVSDGILALMLLDEEQDMQLLEGMLATDTYTLSDDFTPYGRAVKAHFNELFNTPGTTIAALSSEATSIMARALAQCDDRTDRQCINRNLRSGRAFEGLFGPVLIGRDGKAERPVFINRIHDGELQYLFKVN